MYRSLNVFYNFALKIKQQLVTKKLTGFSGLRKKSLDNFLPKLFNVVNNIEQYYGAAVIAQSGVKMPSNIFDNIESVLFSYQL